MIRRSCLTIVCIVALVLLIAGRPVDSRRTPSASSASASASPSDSANAAADVAAAAAAAADLQAERAVTQAEADESDSSIGAGRTHSAEDADVGAAPSAGAGGEPINVDHQQSSSEPIVELASTHANTPVPASDSPAPNEDVDAEDVDDADSTKSATDPDTVGAAATATAADPADDTDQPRSPITNSAPGVCPRNCSGNGKCLTPPKATKSICVCDAGFEDADCSIATSTGADSLPSLWTVLLLLGIVVTIERAYHFGKKYCSHGSGRDTAGFSRVDSPLDDQMDHEQFGDQSINDRL